MSTRVALDDSRINALSMRPEVVKEFPFLSMTTDKHACCGRTIGKQPNFFAIKQAFSKITPEQQARLKELMGVGEVTVFYHDGQNTQSITF